MASYPVSNDEYQADCDARTLMESRLIKNDSSRFSKAMQKIREQHEATGKVLKTSSKDEKSFANGYRKL